MHRPPSPKAGSSRRFWPAPLRRTAEALENIGDALDKIDAALLDLNVAADEARKLDMEIARSHMRENARMQREAIAGLSPQPDRRELE